MATKTPINDPMIDPRTGEYAVIAKLRKRLGVGLGRHELGKGFGAAFARLGSGADGFERRQACGPLSEAQVLARNRPRPRVDHLKFVLAVRPRLPSVAPIPRGLSRGPQLGESAP